mgnify:CR=1 FL=1
MSLSSLLLAATLLLPAANAQDEAASAFDQVDEAMRVGNKAQAANALVAVIDDEAAIDSHAEAYRRLAKVYYEFQLGYSALLAYGKALEMDPEGSAASVATMLDLAEQVGDSELVGGWLAAHPDLVLDPKTAASADFTSAGPGALCSASQKSGNVIFSLRPSSAAVFFALAHISANCNSVGSKPHPRTTVANTSHLSIPWSA